LKPPILRARTRQAAKQSGVRGVVWKERLGVWTARFQRNGRGYYVGDFKDVEVATRELQIAIAEWERNRTKAKVTCAI
jgi:uncharacterized membrane protein YiaA